jgi:hypothetical protein
VANKESPPGASYKGVERRRYPRVEVVGVLRGHNSALDVPIVVLDMSAGGLAVQTSVMFPVGAVNNFRLTPDGGEPVMITGRIVHSLRASGPEGSTHYIIGVEFVTDEEGGGLRGVADLIAARGLKQ